ncbi:nucleotidyl transferase domain-containing protein [Phthorimaea operculella]|nr:nucleotidyl transferase domain-containing protein [Phthorimaea operculella]
MLKAVILIGGPQKGTRFRPLSLETPKPLFPIAGKPLIEHHIAACAKLQECKEILIIGSYPTTQMTQFVTDMQKEYHVIIRYLQEFTPLGTGGGLYHFRDQVRAGNPAAFFLLNGDVCADFPLKELATFHGEKPSALVTIMGTEATRQQSVHYGCMVRNNDSAVTHYVEKPSSYVSTLINCGVYMCSLNVFQTMAEAAQKKQDAFYRYTRYIEKRRNYVSTLINCGVYMCSLNVFQTMAEAAQKKQDAFYSGGESCQNGAQPGYLSWEQDVLSPLAGTNKLFALQVTNWWAQVKTAGSAIYANRHYLELHRDSLPEKACCQIIPDVYLHPTATVDPTAVIGPNVSVGAGVTIKAGVRLKESIVLNNATINEHALVMYAVVGQDVSVGEWSRVEGTPSDPDPNKPFAKMDNQPLFNTDGRLNPSITILGRLLVRSLVLGPVGASASPLEVCPEGRRPHPTDPWVTLDVAGPAISRPGGGGGVARLLRLLGFRFFVVEVSEGPVGSRHKGSSCVGFPLRRHLRLRKRRCASLLFRTSRRSTGQSRLLAGCDPPQLVHAACFSRGLLQSEAGC